MCAPSCASMNAGQDPQNGQYPRSQIDQGPSLVDRSRIRLRTIEASRQVMRQRRAAQLANQPHQIGREPHVQRARPNGLLISRERNAEQRIRVYTLSGDRVPDVERALAGATLGERGAERQQNVLQPRRNRNRFVAQRRQPSRPFFAHRRGCQRGRRRPHRGPPRRPASASAAAAEERPRGPNRANLQ